MRVKCTELWGGEGSGVLVGGGVCGVKGLLYPLCWGVRARKGGRVGASGHCSVTFDVRDDSGNVNVTVFTSTSQCKCVAVVVLDTQAHGRVVASVLRAVVTLVRRFYTYKNVLLCLYYVRLLR